MKIIIDIPDEVYKNPHNYCCYSLANEFKNGIPLEDIKTEIEDLEPDYGNTGYGFESYYKCQSEVLKIIDKHISGKEKE